MYIKLHSWWRYNTIHSRAADYKIDSFEINNKKRLTTRINLSGKELLPPTRLRQHLRDLLANKCYFQLYSIDWLQTVLIQCAMHYT